MIESGDLHLPIGKPVKVLLRSIDVLHNFYVPEFRAKMDMVPGVVTYFWFTPTRTGTFDVLCAELCGLAHAQMRSKVVVQEESEYQAWLEQQQTFAELSGRSAVTKATYKPAANEMLPMRRQVGRVRLERAPMETIEEGMPMVDVPSDATAGAPPAEVADVELYHPKSWWTNYVFSQDAKVIAIQYSLTALAIGLVALVLSWLMRLQLGFPGTFSFIDASQYLQFITMHGMIMVIYLLTALFLGGFGNYLIPLMVGARDMVFPYVNMLSYWIYLLAVLVLAATFFVPGGPTGAGWTLYPPQAILSGTPGQDGASF